MPDMQKSVLAIFCSDIHLSHRPPVLRSSEPNWYEAMERPLRQLRELQHNLGMPPIVCAGDIFHHWNEPVELVNWAIEHLPEMYAIPGQHDLPFHRYEDMSKSAYRTVCLSGKVHNIDPNFTQCLVRGEHTLRLHAFPWGQELKPIKPSDNYIDVAVVHKYVWVGGHSYPGAAEEACIDNVREKLSGYDLAVFGDNHKGFRTLNNINCGTFMIRNADDLHNNPRVWVFYEDRAIKSISLDNTEAICNTGPTINSEKSSFLELTTALSEDDAICFDFEDSLKQYYAQHKVPKLVQTFINGVLESVRSK